MSPYHARLDLFHDVLLARRSTAEGGWPYYLDRDQAALNIVSTSQALQLLRVLGTPYRDGVVSAGMRYLQAAIPTHGAETSVVGGRGKRTRFLSYGLLGLTVFTEARFDEELGSSLRHCLDGLAHAELRFGGWAASVIDVAEEQDQDDEQDGEGTSRLDRPSSARLSLVSTAAAIAALDRLRLHPEFGSLATELVGRARVEITRQARRMGNSAWWSQRADGTRPSAGATALAALSLSNGTVGERQLAAGGVRWLVANPDSWQNVTETDSHQSDRRWVISTPSLVIRATMGIGVHAADDPVIRPAIEFLVEDLWVDEPGAWADEDGGYPTMPGSFATVMAVEALRERWPFDPLADLVKRPAPRRRPRPTIRPRAPYSLRVQTREQRVQIVRSTELLADLRLDKAEAQWFILLAIARRHAEGSAGHDQKAQTVSEDELCRERHVSADTVRKRIRDINSSLRGALAERRSPRFDLIEHFEAPGELGQRRYVLRAVDVEFADGA